jgi:hypothetical protein
MFYLPTPEMAAESSANKLILSLASAFIIGILSLVLIGTNSLPITVILIILPIASYLISLAISSMYQFNKCKKVEIGSISVSNLAVLASTSFMSIIIYIENLPIKLWLFGPQEPVDECCGRPLEPGSFATNVAKVSPDGSLILPSGSKEYAEALISGDQYKLQLFSGIVRAVLPKTMSPELKSGFIAFYWYFFLSLLPQFFLLNIQGAC